MPELVGMEKLTSSKRKEGSNSIRVSDTLFKQRVMEVEVE